MNKVDVNFNNEFECHSVTIEGKRKLGVDYHRFDETYSVLCIVSWEDIEECLYIPLNESKAMFNATMMLRCLGMNEIVLKHWFKHNCDNLMYELVESNNEIIKGLWLNYELLSTMLSLVKTKAGGIFKEVCEDMVKPLMYDPSSLYELANNKQ